MEVSFGEWSAPGYLSKKLLAIKPNDTSPLIRPTYEMKLHWMGDFVNSTAEVQLCNVTKEDQRMYGVHIELGLDKNPMTDACQLYVISGKRTMGYLVSYCAWARRLHF